MAEPISLASGLLTLAGFAFQSTISLYKTVESFQSHKQRVRDLSEELSALSEVLQSLVETIKSISDLDLTALDGPLLRCGNACKDYEKELLKCLSRSSSSHTSIRDWMKLRYLGEDIDGFRRSLAGYKLTINIALTDVHLRKSSATAESITNYNELLNTAKTDFQDHLDRMDEKLEEILGRSVAGSEADTAELEAIQEERMSTEKCLQICAQLSDHIDQIRLKARSGNSQNVPNVSDTVPGKIAQEGLQECKASLARTASKLAAHEKELFEGLMIKAESATPSEEARADLARLRDELEATRQGRDICTKAHEHLKDNVSTIENYATGDAVQYMVSTNEKTIHGKNQGYGWRTRQVGGHIDSQSLQQITRSFMGLNVAVAKDEGSSSQVDNVCDSTDTFGNGPDSKFREYGKGFTMKSKTRLDTPPSVAESADGASGRSSKR